MQDFVTAEDEAQTIPMVGAGDCVENADSKTAVCYAWRSDNQGPHGYYEALEIFTSVQKMFPNATVQASGES